MAILLKKKIAVAAVVKIDSLNQNSLEIQIQLQIQLIAIQIC